MTDTVALTEVKPNQVETAHPDAGAETKSVMTMIERVASDPNFDVVKLEKLMDLQERILNRRAKESFAADYVQMKPNLPKVIRTKSNMQTKSMYAPLEEINTAIDPVLQKHGFGTATKIIAQTDTSVTIRAELWHKDGHVEENTVILPLDKTGIAGTVNKTNLHATASTITYGKRIAICALLNVSTGDDADGNAQAGFITTEQGADFDLRSRALGEKNHDRLMEFLGIQTPMEITTRDYKKAMNALKEMETEANKRRAAAGAKG